MALGNPPNGVMEELMSQSHLIRTSRYLGLLCFTLPLAPLAHASILDSHSRVVADARVDDIVFVDTVNGTGLLEDWHDDEAAELYASARAYTQPNTSGLLRAGVTARAHTSDYFDRAPRAFAQASWRDIAFPTSGQTPEFITLLFEVSGLLGGQGYAFGSSLSVHAGPLDHDGRLSQAQVGVVQLRGAGYFNGEVGDPPQVELFGWDGASIIDGAFVGTFHIDVPYNESLGGYAWGVSLSTAADALRSFAAPSERVEASVDALHSLNLQQALDPQGQVIAVSFDSGLATVPEPFSIAVWGGLAAICGVAYRRQTRQPKR